MKTRASTVRRVGREPAHGPADIGGLATHLKKNEPGTDEFSREPVSNQMIGTLEMVHVELTPHLFTFFPHLKGKELAFEVETARQVIQQLERVAPGIAFYLCDERGSLRPHVNLFIGQDRVVDRQNLTDRIAPGTRVLVMQALSGG